MASGFRDGYGIRKFSRLLWTTLKKSFSKYSGTGGTLIRWGIFAHCTLEYVGEFVICSGPSMEPTIRSHDILFTEHISPRTGNLGRGDIIVARAPHSPYTFICKRIIALPDDHLLHDDGTLQHVPKGHIWIEGDNSDNSMDSRTYGPIPLGLVRGRAVGRIWPFGDATFLVPRKDAPATFISSAVNYFPSSHPGAHPAHLLRRLDIEVWFCQGPTSLLDSYLFRSWVDFEGEEKFLLQQTE
ncbi:unnamed protein product [Orchesella dallaii]|uniref:IMP2-like protein n=1 Tax=Orchesella dallaii TaxID=48710 RepID=A0ABP1Q0M6_9HEXA